MLPIEQGKFFIKKLAKIYVYILVGYINYSVLYAKDVDMNRTKAILSCKYNRVEEDEGGYIRVYDIVTPEEIVTHLYENSITVTEVGTDKIGLEEYYIDLMEGK